MGFRVGCTRCGATTTLGAPPRGGDVLLCGTRDCPSRCYVQETFVDAHTAAVRWFVGLDASADPRGALLRALQAGLLQRIFRRLRGAPRTEPPWGDGVVLHHACGARATLVPPWDATRVACAACGEVATPGEDVDTQAPPQ